MVDLHEAVVGYLTERDWPYEDHGDAVVTEVLADNGSWTAIFDIRDEAQQVIVYSMVPVEVPAERRTDAALYIARANFGLAIGCFEIDLDDGTVRFRTGVDLEGAEVCDAIVDHLFLANVMGVEQYLDGLRSVIGGADPAVAIGMAESFEASPA
jgi:hypothetical protein